MARASASRAREALATLKKELGWSNSDIINVLRGGGSSSKGSDYEREICKMLSLWWTGTRDDVFWRSSGSGARAKVRGRAGAQTAGQHGDIAATDPIGAPLIDKITIEIKRGYSDYTFQDIVDRLPEAGVQEWERWFAQASESAEYAGSFSWMLITRRDRRKALAWFPHSLFTELRKAGAWPEGPSSPFLRGLVSFRDSDGGLQRIDIVCTSLNNFISEVTPAVVRAVDA